MPKKLHKDPCLDDVLVNRFQNGDLEAFNQIIVKYRGLIYNRVYGLLKDRQDAEEITQDTFIRAHRALAAFRGDASLSTWIYQIATNLARNRYWYWFRRKKNQSISMDADLGGEDGTMSLKEILPSEAIPPDHDYLHKEFVDKIRQKLDKLPEMHREILHLRIAEGLSYEEISKRLALQLGTVKSRIARARDCLRKAVEESYS
jgi:RNA polymerase sigma-70 factor (ECF subfamily)